jgi:hypothetical protein
VWRATAASSLFVADAHAEPGSEHRKRAPLLEAVSDSVTSAGTMRGGAANRGRGRGGGAKRRVRPRTPVRPARFLQIAWALPVGSPRAGAQRRCAPRNDVPAPLHSISGFREIRDATSPRHAARQNQQSSNGQTVPKYYSTESLRGKFTGAEVLSTSRP